MINFRQLLTPEQQRKWEYADKRREELRGLSDAEFLVRLEHCVRNIGPSRYHPGDPVYDAVLYHHMLPQVLDRLRRLIDVEAYLKARAECGYDYPAR